MATSTAMRASRSPLSRAIDEFLVDIAQKRDDKNPFLKEVTQQKTQLSTIQDTTKHSQPSADTLRLSVERLEKKKSSGAGIRLLVRVNPFIDALQKLMAICESLVQGCPFGVSVAFAGARIVLELANKYQVYRDQVVEAMLKIGTYLHCYEKFATAHQHSAEMQDLLVRSYKKIIEFWYDTSHQLSQSNFKLVIKGISTSLDKEIKKAVDGLRGDSEAVQYLSNATNAEQRQLDKDNAQKQGIVRWIKGATDDHVDVREDLQDRVRRRHPGTCQWILEDERFKKWHDDRTKSVLWYNAPPRVWKEYRSIYCCGASGPPGRAECRLLFLLLQQPFAAIRHSRTTIFGSSAHDTGQGGSDPG